MGRGSDSSGRTSPSSDTSPSSSSSSSLIGSRGSGFLPPRRLFLLVVVAAATLASSLSFSHSPSSSSSSPSSGGSSSKSSCSSSPTSKLIFTPISPLTLFFSAFLRSSPPRSPFVSSTSSSAAFRISLSFPSKLSMSDTSDKSSAKLFNGTLDSGAAATGERGDEGD